MRYYTFMRTTLDIDADVLQAAEEIAAARKRSAGEVLSELARRGLAAGSSPSVEPMFVEKDGWMVLSRRDPGVVTADLVDRLINESDLESARIRPAV
jgi:hypothetical protein